MTCFDGGGFDMFRWVAALLWPRRENGRAVRELNAAMRAAAAEYDAATERWRELNAVKRAAGCQCGRPATHVRYVRGVSGAQPAGIYSCAEHTNVNTWRAIDYATPPRWVPAGDYTAADLEWVGPPMELLRIEGG